MQPAKKRYGAPILTCPILDTSELRMAKASAITYKRAAAARRTVPRGGGTGGYGWLTSGLSI